MWNGAYKSCCATWFRDESTERRRRTRRIVSLLIQPLPYDEVQKDRSRREVPFLGSQIYLLLSVALVVRVIDGLPPMPVTVKG